MTPSRCRLPCASTNPNGSLNSYSVCSMDRTSRALDALAAQGQALDRDVLGRRVQGRSLPLARPGVVEVPLHDVPAVVVLHDDRAVAPVDRQLPVENALVPLVELVGVGQAPLQRDVGE